MDPLAAEQCRRFTQVLLVKGSACPVNVVLRNRLPSRLPKPSRIALNTLATVLEFNVCLWNTHLLFGPVLSPIYVRLVFLRLWPRRPLTSRQSPPSLHTYALHPPLQHLSGPSKCTTVMLYLRPSRLTHLSPSSPCELKTKGSTAPFKSLNTLVLISDLHHPHTGH